MVNFRKLAKFALTGSLAFGFMIAANSIDAQAAKPKSVTFDYAEQTLKVERDTNEKSAYFYVAVDVNGKVTTERIAYDWKADNSAMETTTTVNLAGLNYSKANKITVYNETDIVDGKVDDTVKSDAIEIKAQAKKITAKLGDFTKNEGLKIEADGKTLENGTIDKDGKITKAAGWEYRTLYGGDWTNGAKLTSSEFEKYTTYGTTLIIRQAPLTKGEKDAAGTEVAESNLPSKEVKLKIPKKANGPKATLDPVNLTVTIPAKCEWRVVGFNLTKSIDGARKDIWTVKKDAKGAELEGWVSSTTKTSLTPDEFTKQIITLNPDAKIKGKDDKGEADKEIAPNFLEGATIELRTAATTKKAASKVSYITIPKQGDKVEEKDYTTTIKFDGKKSKITGIIIKAGEKDLQVATVKKDTYFKTEGTGDSAKDYPIQNSAFPKTVKFKTIKATKETTVPVPKDGEVLIIRTLGTKATKTTSLKLAGEFDLLDYTLPVKATELTGISLEKGTDVNKTKIKFASSLSSGFKYMYEVVKKEVKELPYEQKAQGTEIKAQETDNVSAEAGNYIVIYEYKDDSTKEVTKFKCIKVESSHITAPTPTPASK